MSAKTAAVAVKADCQSTYSAQIFREYLPLVDPILETTYKEVEVKGVHYINRGDNKVNLSYLDSQGETKRGTYHLSPFAVAADKRIYVQESYWQGWLK